MDDIHVFVIKILIDLDLAICPHALVKVDKVRRDAYGLVDRLLVGPGRARVLVVTVGFLFVPLALAQDWWKVVHGPAVLGFPVLVDAEL